MKKKMLVVFVAVLTIALLFSWMTAVKTSDVISASLESEIASGGVAGKSRDLDSQRIQILIEQGKLSSHEAEFYNIQSDLLEEKRATSK